MATTSEDKGPRQPAHLSEFYSLFSNGKIASGEEEAGSVQGDNRSLFRNSSVASLNTMESSIAGHTTTASVTGSMFQPQNLPALITTREISDTLTCYSNVLDAAATYRDAIMQASAAAAQFGAALEECSRCKGAGKSSDGLLAAGGLEYMVSNHEQILANSIEASFEKPVKEQLDVLKNTADKNEQQFKAQLKEKTKQLRTQEKLNQKLARKRTRNLSEYRISLQELTYQIDEIDRLKYDYFQSAYELVQNTSTKILGHASSVVRAQVEIYEGIARKGWSGGGLDDLIANCPDPFADDDQHEEENDGINVYALEEEEDQHNLESNGTQQELRNQNSGSSGEGGGGLFGINGEEPRTKNRSEKIYSILSNNKSILPVKIPDEEDTSANFESDDNALSRSQSHSTLTGAPIASSSFNEDEVG
ncbi:hypothetical protein TRICI_002488 [Trichomonascus ciferrii]|uniref:IMD domain-containing protein n=1 Tax=Trichomonascus ciferrii TaxID=44093 RepID=A0A642V6W9_9ASCO|nr:hypothetical protein TRICI_002488 [Trichomonascus ciferrii]